MRVKGPMRFESDDLRHPAKAILPKRVFALFVDALAAVARCSGIGAQVSPEYAHGPCEAAAHVIASRYGRMMRSTLQIRP